MNCLLSSISISTWGTIKQYTPVYVYSRSTQWCINVHGRLSVKQKNPFECTQSLTTVVKMVCRSLDQKDEIGAYIKARSKIGCSLKQLMTELSTA